MDSNLRIGDSLKGARVLVTQSRDFMGPALCEAFAAHGAVVVADERALDAPRAVHDMVRGGRRGAGADRQPGRARAEHVRARGG